MTDEQFRKNLHQAMERRLSGIQADPRLAQRVIAASEGERPVKKKISVSLALALVLILLASAALAAGLGLFDRLAKDQQAETDKARLNVLNARSESAGATITTDDGITVEIDQCYYEGDRVFISYRESGRLYDCVRHEGPPDDGISWDWTEKDFVCAQNMMSVVPKQQEDILWLNGEGKRWEEVYDASLHDGLKLADGTYLDIIGGDIAPQEDGSIIGWKECEVPAGKSADTLDLIAVLFRTDSIRYQDGHDYYSATTRGEETKIAFTVKRNNAMEYLSGTFMNDTYAVAADLQAGMIDIRGEIRLSCPAEWVKAHEDWTYHTDEDLIEEYQLYQNDMPLENGGPDYERYENGMILFGIMYTRPESLEGLKLVPIYTQSGAHFQEAIPLVRPVNN